MSDEIINRLARQSTDMVKVFIARRMSPLSKLCESPIEVALGAALVAAWELDSNGDGQPRGGRLFLSSDNKNEYKSYMRAGDNILIPQYRVSGYRLDFLLMHHLTGGRYWKAAIECDGHVFHEKTKEQAARDKARDRAIATENIAVFRFTGSEIHRDAFACAAEIIAAADSASEAELLRDMPGGDL